jgi:serine/threonine-protein kinase HipA
MDLKKLSKNQRIILDAIHEYSELTVKELINLTGIARRTLQDNLTKLIGFELVQRHGENNDIFYTKGVLNKNYEKRITVFKEGIRVGELVYSEEDGHYFEYDKTFKERVRGLPNFKEDKQRKYSELFAVFENLIPEYTRRDRLRDANKNELLADLLVKLKNTHGAYDFFYTYKEHEFTTDYSKRPNWINVKNKILDSNEYPNVLEFHLDIEKEVLESTAEGEHSHLSGNQNKIDINIDFEQKRIYEDLEDTKYLLKPYNPDMGDYFLQHKDRTKRYYPFISINEHLFMSFAKNELGFDVPYTALIKGEIEFHYLTKRYDRYGEYKYQQYDFAQYLDIKSDKKYKPTSEELFIKINEVLSTNEAKMEALRFYYYSSLIMHADLHVKNIGALSIGKNKMILAPLYDLISVGVYNFTNTHALGLSVNHRFKKQKKKFRVDDFYGLAEILGISEKSFFSEAKQITKIFVAKLPEYIKKTKKLYKYDQLKINSTRAGYSNFVTKLENFYNEKIIELMQLGTLYKFGILKENERASKLYIEKTPKEDIYKEQLEYFKNNLKFPINKYSTKQMKYLLESFQYLQVSEKNPLLDTDPQSVDDERFKVILKELKQKIKSI